MVRLSPLTRAAATLALTLAALAPAAPALAGDSPQPPESAIEQYSEAVPSATGPKSPGVVAKKKQHAGTAASPAAPQPTAPALSPAVQTQLRARTGRDAAKLKKIATSPDLGAPVRHLGAREPRVSAPTPSSSRPSADRALSTAVTTIGGADTARTVVLVVALLLTTAAALAGVARRASAESQSRFR